MGRPTTRAELLKRIGSDYVAMRTAVDAVPADARETSGACEEWSVKDLLAHLDAWHKLFLGWEAAGRAGDIPQMPAPDLTWKQTPELNSQIFQRTRDDAWDDVAARLDTSHERVRDVVAAYSDDELFTKKRYRWTGTTSVGSYAVSATTSHYDWVRKQVRAFAKGLPS